MKKGVGAYTGSGVKLQGWQELWEGNAHQNHRAPMGPVKFPWASAGRAGNKCCLLSFLKCLQRFSQVSDFFFIAAILRRSCKCYKESGSIHSLRKNWLKQKERKSPLRGFSGTTSAAAGLIPYPTTFSWLDSLLLTSLFHLISSSLPPYHFFLHNFFLYTWN